LNDPRTASRLPEVLPTDPMQWADAWIKDATASSIQPHANAMTLATVADGAQPSSRVVLCKDFVPDPGFLVFYTNYNSRKSREIASNPQVAVSFHWDILGRQIRIEGTAVRSPDDESDRYFASRDHGSQLGAWGSDQSDDLESRDALIAQIRSRAHKLGIELDSGTEPAAQQSATKILRPPHWGGFRVWVKCIELWVSGEDRIHDRALWRRNLDTGIDGNFTVTPWIGSRLQP
jgi:pyridoxamine 5'-phosphate oxidase